MIGDFKVEKSNNYILNAFIMCCMVFSSVTIFSSLLQLYNGRPTDGNIHIIFRGLLVLMGVCSFQAFRAYKKNSKIIFIAIHYSITMMAALFGVWCLGFFDELAQYAYRDSFLNYSVIYIVVAIIVRGLERRKVANRI